MNEIMISGVMRGVLAIFGAAHKVRHAPLEGVRHLQ